MNPALAFIRKLRQNQIVVWAVATFVANWLLLAFSIFVAVNVATINRGSSEYGIFLLTLLVGALNILAPIGLGVYLLLRKPGRAAAGFFIGYALFLAAIYLLYAWDKAQYQ